MKKQKIRILLMPIIIGMIICLIFLCLEIKHKEKTLKIEAASAFYPFSVSLSEQLHNDNKYIDETVKMVSTSQAYLDIINGNADIIIASEPSDEQKNLIKDANVNLEFKLLYLEPLAILINSFNDVDNLSIDEIKDIYYNNNPEWNTYQLEKNNGSQTCFESIVKNNKLGDNHYEINTMPKIVDDIASDRKGIGYAFYSYFSKMHTNKNAKIINVNNKNINDKDYPLLFEVYLIYRSEDVNENILNILDLLETEEYKNLIEYIK